MTSYENADAFPLIDPSIQGVKDEAQLHANDIDERVSIQLARAAEGERNVIGHVAAALISVSEVRMTITGFVDEKLRTASRLGTVATNTVDVAGNVTELVRGTSQTDLQTLGGRLLEISEKAGSASRAAAANVQIERIMDTAALLERQLQELAASTGSNADALLRLAQEGQAVSGTLRRDTQRM